jgi:hypothetical protein
MRNGLRASLAAVALMAAAPFLFAAPELRVAVRADGPHATQPFDGRLLLLVSKDPAAEPRFQISDGASTPPRSATR